MAKEGAPHITVCITFRAGLKRREDGLQPFEIIVAVRALQLAARAGAHPDLGSLVEIYGASQR